MSSSRPNWVKERAECTLHFAFERLCREIRDDLEAMKAYPSVISSPDDVRVIQKDGVFEIESDDPRQIDKEALLRVERSRTDIRLRRPSAEGQILESRTHPQWNPDRDRCDLLYEGKLLQHWEVSKAVLEPLFFASSD